MSVASLFSNEASESRPRGSQMRHWCFTLANYTPEELTKIDDLVANGSATYVCYQGELCPTTGTPHLQGFVSFKNARQLGGVKRLIGSRAHLEPMRGTASQSVEYCRKEESRDPNGPNFREFGVCPVGAGTPGARSDLSAVAQLIKDGKRARDVFDENPSLFIRNFKGIERSIALLEPVRAWKTAVFWYYGPTGTGKSRRAQEEAPNAYWKDPSNSWWDGYEGHEDVIIDDYRADFCKFSYLLRVFDRYPLSVQVKGGTRNFLAKRIFVTTPKSVSDTWISRTPEDLGQLSRRVENELYVGPEVEPIIFN